jgi:hypothetical protein
MAKGYRGVPGNKKSSAMKARAAIGKSKSGGKGGGGGGGGA